MSQPKNEYFFQSGFWNWIFYLFISKPIDEGQKRSFDFDMLRRAPDDVNFNEVYPDWILFYQNQRTKYPKKKFYYILLHFLGSEFYLGSGLKVISYLIQIPLPYLIERYLNWIQDSSASATEGWVITGIISLLALLKPLFFHRAMVYLIRCTMKANISIRAQLLEHLMKIPLSSISVDSKSKKKNSNEKTTNPQQKLEVNPGLISTLLSSELNSLGMSMRTRSHLYQAPFLVIIYTILLYLQIGIISLSSPIIIGILVFIQIKLNKLLYKVTLQRSKVQAERGDTISSFLEGAKGVKMRGWEHIVSNEVSSIRKRELKLNRKWEFIRGLS